MRTPYRLTSAREIARLTALAIGTEKGMACPGSRYGRYTEDVAPWAVAMHVILSECNGGYPEDEEAASIDGYMSLVVNDSEDIGADVADNWELLPRGLRQALGGRRYARRLSTNY